MPELTRDPRVDPKPERQPGWYWVKFANAYPPQPNWLVANLQRGLFHIAGYSAVTDQALSEIGPRIPSPDEAPTMQETARPELDLLKLAYRAGLLSMRSLAEVWIENNYSTNSESEQIKYSIRALPVDLTPTAEEYCAQLAERKPAGEPSEEWWDQHSVQCGNCSVEILTRKGSIPENTGLSDTGGSEDESLCGRCAGTQMYAYMDQLNAPSPSLEALPLDAWEALCAKGPCLCNERCHRTTDRFDCLLQLGESAHESLPQLIARVRALTDRVAVLGAMKVTTESMASERMLAVAAVEHAYVEKLRAQEADLVELQKDRWQPIETAPKPGVQVLLWAPGWSCETGIYIRESALTDEGWHHWEGSRKFTGDPTHWQPLPTPPGIDAATKEGK